MDTKGGRVTIQIGSTIVSCRASAKIIPNTLSLENGVNQDGTGYSNIKPELAEIDINFDRGDPSKLKWDNAMMLQKPNVTFMETDMNVTHMLTGASWWGRPTIDTANGEVTGCKLQSDRYQQISG